MDDDFKTQEIPIVEPLTAERIRELWSRTYNTQGKPDWSHLFPLYHDNIIFDDSIQHIEGKAQFMAMCNRLAGRCEKLNMDILSIVMDGDPLINSLMGSFLIEVIGIFPDNSGQLLAIKDECMVQAFSSQAANIPFTNTICSRRLIRRSQFFDA